MKFSSHATIEGAPKFEVQARAEPIGVKAGAEGAGRASIGPVNARVAAIPITLVIPFLGGVKRVGAVGPFDLHLDAVDVAVERFELRCEGVLGPDGLTCGLEGGVGCKMEIDLTGTLPGRVAKAALEFADTDEPWDER